MKTWFIKRQNYFLIKKIMRAWLTNIQWCAGCGDTLLIMAIKNVFKELKIESHNRVVVTGIGCSWKSSQYIDGYAAETLHWRWVPFATWIKMANPELTVVAISGDWDGLWIGMGHLFMPVEKILIWLIWFLIMKIML